MACISTATTRSTPAPIEAESKFQSGRLFVRVINRTAYDLGCYISATNGAYYEFIARARRTTRWFAINDPRAGWEWRCA